MNTALNPAVQEALKHVSNQETVKHILMGDYGAIIATQKLLAVLKYTEFIFWTQPQPIGTTGEYISVLIKRGITNVES